MKKGKDVEGLYRKEKEDLREWESDKRGDESEHNKKDGSVPGFFFCGTNHLPSHDTETFSYGCSALAWTPFWLLF